MTTTRVGLLAFDDCDAMDLIGPYEVLLTANRLLARDGREPAFEVLVVGEAKVAVYGGLRIAPSVAPRDVEHLDVLVVPGAIDIDAASPDDAVRVLAPRSDVLTSVCTGAFSLQRLGLVDGLEVTTHWEDVGVLRDAGAQVRDDLRWVDSGALVTSGGISSGIAMTLHLVARYVDRALAEATARQIDYVWTESR
ncbi:DJ-1/PfpI family protein [Nocardioides sp. HDW12B]|uniref:DJ-1/PfpI family protein n=1 Tax=Nocardioides sp. HDW12B TaxID=2714939 RepID=UPI00140D6018|nr:DJ-1/PfpI family protein [Nocardioides sp. HDW12B]QIK66615.1 DJ-1/PfpI family protein [Nocardioides sp. HDW12B]